MVVFDDLEVVEECTPVCRSGYRDRPPRLSRRHPVHSTAPRSGRSVPVPG